MVTAGDQIPVGTPFKKRDLGSVPRTGSWSQIHASLILVFGLLFRSYGTPGEGRTLVSGSGGQHSNPLSYGGMRRAKIIMAGSGQQGVAPH